MHNTVGTQIASITHSIADDPTTASTATKPSMVRVAQECARAEDAVLPHRSRRMTRHDVEARRFGQKEAPRRHQPRDISHQVSATVRSGVDDFLAP
nr:hypothetical protein CFP56_28611 [Quercus suber]